MGSSTKKKNDKKKDFQKPKLRVGKAKAKADNFTDTSFTSKSIVVNQQSLKTSAPTQAAQFAHYLSLASSSKSDTQRRDALAFLTTTLASQPVNLTIPVPVAILLPKLLPLALDGSSSVRTQLLQFLRQLPPKEVSDRTEAALLYIRAGMTHLAVQIRNDALGLMEWLLDASSEAVVSCSGGWVKTLKAFLSMMGWAESSTSTSWTSAAKTSLAKGGASFPRQMLVFAKFLEVGLGNLMSDSPYQNGRFYPLWDSEVHRVASTSSPYAHLNLFGQMRDEENEMYHERDSRQRVFSQRFQSSITKGIDNAKKEGGEIGRAAAFLEKTVKKSMEDYESLDMDTLE